MKFYHGTSIRGWIGILKSGSMDSKRVGDTRVSALYSKFKGNYLTTNRKIAEMYANKAGNGVVLEVDYDPLESGRVNNFKEQQAAGKDFFVEETPLEVDGVNCKIDTKDPLKNKAKLRAELKLGINKTTEGTYMTENSEFALRRAWQKLEESKFGGLTAMPGEKKPIQVSQTDQSKLTPQNAIQLSKQTDKMNKIYQQNVGREYDPANDTMFEGGELDRSKIESIYEFGGQILDSADAQGIELDETQIDAINQRIIQAMQGEGRDPSNFEAIVDDIVADEAHGAHTDGVGGGIMESIDQSLKLLKMLQEKKGPCWKGYQQVGMKDKGGKEVPNCVPMDEKAPAWQRKEGKNPEGGLNAKGRASAKKQGHDLKPPVSKDQAKKSPKSAARRKSFCARMKGMKSKMTGSEKKNDPDSRINKSLRKWDC
jgi:hypothetical protein